MTSLWQFFSWIGDWERVVIIGMVLLAVFVRLGWRREAILLFSTVVVAKAASILLKHFIARERPDLTLWLTDASGFSFPSGHATVAMALYGGLGYILWKRSSSLLHRYLAVAFCLIMVIGIGLSRIFLQVHWLTDVLGGWVLGGTILVALLASSQAEAVKNR